MIGRCSAIVGVALLGILSSAADARADEQVDPRFSYAIEADANVGLFAAFGSIAHSQPVFGGTVSFLGPVAENRQISVSLRGGYGHNGTGSSGFGALAVGYRSIKEFESVQTRLDLQLVGDLSRITGRGLSGSLDFGLGGRAAVGALYLIGNGWRVGGEFGISFIAIHLHAQAELSPIVTYSW